MDLTVLAEKQPQGIQTDDDRAALMRGDPDRQRNNAKNRRHRHQHHDPQGDGEILADDAFRPPAQYQRRQETFNAVMHEDDFGLLQGGVAAPCPHCHTDVGGGKARGVIHPVTDHGGFVSG